MNDRPEQVVILISTDAIDRRNRVEVIMNRQVHRAACILAFRLGRRQRLDIEQSVMDPSVLRPRKRWIAARPEIALTWGKKATGHRFVRQVAAFGAFNNGAAVLEVGPGYGRLLAALVDQGVPFGRYLGVDISKQNIDHLRNRFRLPNVEFMQGDIETTEIPGTIDVILSSLTFKHLYPSFERCLRNVGRNLRPGGLVCFDLIEGEEAYYEADGITFVRCYSMSDVARVLGRAGLDAIAFETVWHTPTRPRLLVVAQRPSTGLDNSEIQSFRRAGNQNL